MLNIVSGSIVYEWLTILLVGSDPISNFFLTKMWDLFIDF
jgi:hypothetical protein